MPECKQTLESCEWPTQLCQPTSEPQLRHQVFYLGRQGMAAVYRSHWQSCIADTSEVWAVCLLRSRRLSKAFLGSLRIILRCFRTIEAENEADSDAAPPAISPEAAPHQAASQSKESILNAPRKLHRIYQLHLPLHAHQHPSILTSGKTADCRTQST